MAKDNGFKSKRIRSVTTGINHLFPLFLKMEEMQVLIVGAGSVGLEKLHALVQNSPATKILIVAEQISEAVTKLAKHYPGVRLEERTFERKDLAGKDIVIIAVNDKATSLYIRDLAKKEKIWVNVADTPGLCDFYLGSIVRKGNLKIAISTNGKSPTVAKRLREVLQKLLPDKLSDVVDHLHIIRTSLHGDFDLKVKKLDAITRVLVNKEESENCENKSA
jgi:siroheme synthase-like protein